MSSNETTTTATTPYAMERHVVPGHVVMHRQGIDGRVCQRTRNKYAIHFSHYAMEFGSTLQYGSRREDAGPQERAKVALDWLQQWKDTCRNNPN
eukprot:CAMPEP_0116578610 /NCGR_PEP_ID=MMETSP0397-20121206/21806_1 /TAXON_ID=216820 /ORGANISM="Cyclophora tenuis, Strain ECT3854" /LENGTH=93 /DNA_ID=CAMNT_0004108027 /DNA_START=171 /DNA_END=452 /DNA_ORIENTATION=+